MYSFEFPVRNVTGAQFRQGVVTADGQNLVFLAADKGSKDALMVFSAKTGAASHKILIRQAGVKVKNSTSVKWLAYTKTGCNDYTAQISITSKTQLS